MKSHLETHKPFKIGRQYIGNNFPPIFLPDIGTFFNQNIELAIEMIDQLKVAKIPAVKGEILHSADVCLPYDHQESFLSSDGKTIIAENYRELIERKVVSLDDYSTIFEHCHKQDIDFVVSVYDHEGVRFAKDYNAAALKVSSSNITHYPLIASIVDTKLPIIIDTGHATIAEAVRAVEWCRSLGENRIIVEHSPPAPPKALISTI